MTVGSNRQPGIDPGETLGEHYTTVLERAEALRQYLGQRQSAQEEIMTHAALYDAGFDLQEALIE